MKFNTKSRTGRLEMLWSSIQVFCEKQKIHCCSREEFFGSLNDPRYEELFAAWEKSDFERNLRPEITLKDFATGYRPENWSWVTKSDLDFRKGMQNAFSMPSRGAAKRDSNAGPTTRRPCPDDLAGMKAWLDENPL
jgi:hypothetical protein